MADISFTAAYASVVEDPKEGFVFIGLAEGEDETESYVLFRQALTGGPVWFELGGDEFGAEDALLSVRRAGDTLQIALRPERAARFGFALAVEVGLAGCEDAEAALEALREMLPGQWKDG